MHRLVYAHRGGAALAPENTLAAFDNAAALGAHGMELDVRMSRDGVPVVIHDPTLERTTDASGPVSARTADELAQVDAGHKFADASGAFPFRGQGIGVPRLEEVVRRYPNAHLIIEMKDDSEELADAVVQIVRAADAAKRAILASFHSRPIFEARRTAPELRTGASQPEVRAALYATWCGMAPRKPPYVGFQIPEKAGRLRLVSPRFVRCVTRAKLAIAVWTVNEPADMHRLLDWGVTGLITDRPDVAVPLVKQL